MGFFKRLITFFWVIKTTPNLVGKYNLPKRSYLYFTTVFAQALCGEITGSMPSSHSLAILAILDFSRHLDTCFKLTTMMQTSALYNWLLPFRGLLGSFEALIESKSGLRFRKWKVDFCKNKFDRKNFQVKSRVYDVTLLYQLLFWKELLAVIIGTGGRKLQKSSKLKKIAKQGLIGLIKVSRVNLGFIM